MSNNTKQFTRARNFKDISLEFEYAHTPASAHIFPKLMELRVKNIKNIFQLPEIIVT